MKFALAVVLTAVAVAASAQSGANALVAYQTTLLSRPVPADVKAFCTAKAGASSGGVYDACRVTRLFLADYSANRAPAFPPMADLPYTSGQAEQDLLVKALAQFSR